MVGLPVMLNVQGRRCVIGGGGSVAVRRATALLEARDAVCVIAPQVDPKLDSMPVAIRRRAHESGDVQGAFLAIVATDDTDLNDPVTCDARATGALVNSADDSDAGDVSVSAHHRHGPVTIAVDMSGISASAAAAIRRQLSEALDPDWLRLPETVAPYRAKIQHRFADNATRRLETRAQVDQPRRHGHTHRQRHRDPDAFLQATDGAVLGRARRRPAR